MYIWNILKWKYVSALFVAPRSIHVLVIGLHWYCCPMLKEIVPNPSGGENVRGKLHIFKHTVNGITDFSPCQPCVPFNSNDPLYQQLLNLLHYQFIDIMNGHLPMVHVHEIILSFQVSFKLGNKCRIVTNPRQFHPTIHLAPEIREICLYFGGEPPISSELPPMYPIGAMCFFCNWPMIFGVWFHWLGSTHFQKKWKPPIAHSHNVFRLS